ncbi:hypothetical protein [Aureimonas sp. SK2]|uniref:hypothetical protein n=1 Tax=Aureimonas sp. SK2 TaxID=3015992 RepID=UPI002444D156|nr:hypothetical protein [Aureimonas sp. SK2]
MDSRAIPFSYLIVACVVATVLAVRAFTIPEARTSRTLKPRAGSDLPSHLDPILSHRSLSRSDKDISANEAR